MGKETPHEIKVRQLKVAINDMVYDRSAEVPEIIASIVAIIEELEIHLDALRSISG